jgi:hypothetical protein
MHAKLCFVEPWQSGSRVPAGLCPARQYGKHPNSCCSDWHRSIAVAWLLMATVHATGTA